MAYTKKPPKASEAFQKFKSDLAAGRIGNAYIFCGEETYLREHYLKDLRDRLIPAGFEEFNYHTLDGKDLTAELLAETAEAMPMLSERTLIVASDFDIFKLNEDQREKLIAFLEDIPPYCCIVFVYDTVDYKPNRTMKKLYKAVTDHVQVVEFRPADNSDLVVWIARRFKALGKEIDRQTAEYLIFTCGGLMTGLVPEIAKIGAYAKGRAITQKDIDAVADPVLSAEVFALRRGAPGTTTGGPDPGGPAEAADGAHRDPGGTGQSAAADLHSPHGHRQWQGPLLAHGALGDEERLPGKAPALRRQKDHRRLVRRCGEDVPGAGPADEERAGHGRRGRAEAAAGAAGGAAAMKRIREVIVVEGRYDKNTISQVVDAAVVTLGGFAVFNDREKLSFLRRLAEERGLIVLTDSDGAGFVIRNYLKGALPRDRVKQAYIPDIPGKERRKRSPGKEGKLGVEGMKSAVLLEALRRAGATFEDEAPAVERGEPITKADLYALGLTGGTGSAERRQVLLRRLDLPEHLTPNAMLEALNLLYDRASFLALAGGEET